MNDDEAREVVRAVLHEVAPEADLDTVGPGEALQEAFDLDSIDFLNFAEGIHERTGIEVHERDYPELATLSGCVAYLTKSVSGTPASD
ncbi:MAG: acyl carrier protein [Acidobacteriota bacterium]|nr:acyl carrier protein [Acidobacteriota bacterium]